MELVAEDEIYGHACGMVGAQAKWAVEESGVTACPDIPAVAKTPSHCPAREIQVLSLVLVLRL